MYQDMMDTIGFVGKYDPEVSAAMEKELERQRRNLELIASENIVSPAVMAAMGSVLTNKYAEGLPHKRYYGGCEYVDVVEEIAIDRAKKLFGAKFANVQPHSGAQANTAVYFALLQPGDTVLGMSLAHGGHLTHGSPVNISGKYFNFVSYGLGDDETIDYDKVATLAKEHKPKMIVAGSSAYPRIIDFPKLAEIAKSAATRPAMCAMSTIRYAPTDFSISASFGKSMILGYALAPATIIFGLCSFARVATLS